jgi:hypothetical protein
MSSLVQRIVFGVPFALATLALAACGGISRSGPVPDQTLPNAPALGQARVVAPLPDQANIVAPLLEHALPKITGSYAGTLTLTADGQHLSGALTIDVENQKGKRISGTWDAQIESEAENLRFTGTVRPGKAGAARVKLKITDLSGACHGNATGTVTKAGAFSGKGSGQSCGSFPKFTFTYKTQKQ